MANFVSIARPYAHAAFEVAREKQQLETWGVFLETAASIAQYPPLARLLNNPNVPTSALLDLFNEALGPLHDTNKTNFLLLSRCVAAPLREI